MICSVTLCFSEFVSIMVFTDLKNISTSMLFIPDVCCHHVANTEQHSGFTFCKHIHYRCRRGPRKDSYYATVWSSQAHSSGLKEGWF